jgi:hypothetical protein
MSHIPLTPQPSPAAESVPEDSYHEQPSTTGVRKVLEAYAEREVQKVRWSAVIAGLFLAVGTQILLGLLGAAVGLTAMDARAPNPMASFGPSAGVWTAVVALFSLFVGGYAAAKLSGSIRRADGVLSGTLTWASSLVVALWLTFAGLSAAATAASPTQSVPGGSSERAAREHAGEAARGVWFAFAGVSLSLIAAIIGGAAGAVGGRSEGDIATRRRELRRREEEQAHQREAIRQRDERQG